DIIGKTALLELKLVEQGPFSDEAQARQAYGNNLPPDLQILPGASAVAAGERPTTVYYVTRRVPAVTGRDLRNARTSLDENSRPAVSFSLNNEGAAKFGAFTGANINRQLAIVLDNRINTAPNINSRIDNEGIIEGQFTAQAAADLALVLRSGSLPASLTTLEERTVGPSLGRDSIRQGFMASAIGFGLLVIAIIAYYRGAGINAVLALLLNLIILLGMLAYFDAKLTLPGIAGIILTLGMAVDSNVLVFERIREELREGRTVRASIEQGFARAFGTIIDTHLTTIISALFLFQFGTGPIRGFAVTLLIGLVASVFTAFFVSRIIFDIVYKPTDRPREISI
ncbi:MAG TPA: protein translocase subunit SecD, partial [Thermoanaerobaculia bacterium]